MVISGDADLEIAAAEVADVPNVSQDAFDRFDVVRVDLDVDQKVATSGVVPDTGEVLQSSERKSNVSVPSFGHLRRGQSKAFKGLIPVDHDLRRLSEMFRDGRLHRGLYARDGSFLGRRWAGCSPVRTGATRRRTVGSESVRYFDR
jgi:hypothetical protein